MKTLIAYSTKHGAAESSAKKLSEKLNGDVDLLNLKKANDIQLSNYDKVIIGSSVYMGKIRKEAFKFCNDNLSSLKDVKVGLYICCMTEGDDALKQLKDNFPKELVDSAIVKGVFGGEFDFKKMNFLEKMVIKKVAGVEETESKLLQENIAKFADELNIS